MTNGIDLECFSKLKAIVDDGIGARIDEFEQTVAELRCRHNPDYIKMYLGLLKDDCLQDENAFSLVHAAEDFDDDVYVRCLFDYFPFLSEKSPGWASILLVRILNSDNCRAVAIKEGRNSSSAVKGALNKILKGINEEAPELLGITIGLIMSVASINQ